MTRMMLTFRDPRVRAVLLIIVAPLGLGLAIHLAGEHSMAADACVALIVSNGLVPLFPTRPLRIPIGAVL